MDYTLVQWMCDVCGRRLSVPYGVPVRCACGSPSKMPIDKHYKNKKINVTAVSTFKPDGSAHQEQCVKSWESFGLNVAILEGKRPSIAELVSYGRQFSDDVLLINSDIEAYGSNEQLLRLKKEKTFGVGIRWNYKETPELSVIERYGLDVFFIPKHIVVPEDGFLIGFPLWDYWLPWHVTNVQLQPFQWIGRQLFFHKRHPLRWNDEDFYRSSAKFNATYTPPESWLDWRAHLDPLKVNGRLAWLALHAYNPKKWDPKKALQWVTVTWRKMIPSYGCSCGETWDKLIISFPPDVSSREAFHSWARERHGDINEKLKKPRFPKMT